MDFSKVSTAFVLFPSGDADQSILKNTAEYQGLVSNGSIQRIEASAIPSEGQFDLVFGLEANIKNNEDALFTILKPDGQLAAAKNAPVQGLSFSLKIAGFVAGIEDANVSVYRKPAYEMGSSVQVDKKNVWSLDDNMDDDDLINDEDLLDEQDKQKPNAEDLRVCATTKQRKACANCSCGLKEELEADEVVKVRENSQNAKSSCGNCYLGDAFRCAACPYRGIPAFKPGEKVTIDVGNDEI